MMQWQKEPSKRYVFLKIRLWARNVDLFWVQAKASFSFRTQTQSNHDSSSRASAFPSTHDDLEVEQDVRAMEVEADHLRRNSRAHTTIESPLPSTNPAFQFGSHGEPSNTSRSRGKMRVTDISPPSKNETSHIKRGHRRKSSVNGRGKRVSSSFEATGILCEFTLYSTKISPKRFYVNRSTTQFCIRWQFLQAHRCRPP